MRSSPVSSECTLHLRHETGRAPDDEYKSLIKVTYVDSSRAVRRPVAGVATAAVACRHCGRQVEFTVSSVERARRLRARWTVLLLAVLVILLLGIFSVIYLFAGWEWTLLSGLPSWVFWVPIYGILPLLWVLPYVLFHRSNEFGVRSQHSWRFTDQHPVTDELRGSYVGACPGKWDRQPGASR